MEKRNGVAEEKNWLVNAIDLFASEYGWTKDYILKRVYPDEAIDLKRAIDIRTFNKYLIELAIEHNPHSEKPEKLRDEFLERADADINRDEDIDKQGLKQLKMRLNRHSKAVKVK